MWSMQPIGCVRSPYGDTREVPKGLGAKHEAEGVLEIRAEFEPGCSDIEFPTCSSSGHSPQRPNPIGLTVVELLSREGSHLRVRGIDMLDGTPILDIKPYLSNVPPEDLRRGWLAEAERRTEEKR
jgi:tRNA (Thr-GGU) A37 N-methylase